MVRHHDDLTLELAGWAGWYGNTPSEPSWEDIGQILNLAHRINDERVDLKKATKPLDTVEMP